MRQFVIGVRCLFMGGAMLLALPLSGDVFEVRGGSSGDSGDCDTVFLGTTNCVAKTGRTCDGDKSQCKGCTEGDSGNKESKCNLDSFDDCGGGGGCVENQKSSALSGDSCISQPCPGSGGGT